MTTFVKYSYTSKNTLTGYIMQAFMKDKKTKKRLKVFAKQ